VRFLGKFRWGFLYPSCTFQIPSLLYFPITLPTPYKYTHSRGSRLPTRRLCVSAFSSRAHRYFSPNRFGVVSKLKKGLWNLILVRRRPWINRWRKCRSVRITGISGTPISSAQSKRTRLVRTLFLVPLKIFLDFN
jgi:hypothetical protein